MVRVSNTRAQGYRAIVTDIGGTRLTEVVTFRDALGLRPPEARALAEEAAAQYEEWWRAEGEAGVARPHADTERRREAQEQGLVFRRKIKAAQDEYAAVRAREREQRAAALSGMGRWAADREARLREERERFRATLTGDEGIRWQPPSCVVSWLPPHLRCRSFCLRC